LVYVHLSHKPLIISKIRNRPVLGMEAALDGKYENVEP